jgi:predicted nuclease with RNAse H fold
MQSAQADKKRIVGIDLGGRTTAKTAVCVLHNRRALVHQAHEVAKRSKEDDDEFVDFVLSLNPDVIAIDAPLCLPALTNAHYSFRPADRLAGAMSPWQIGPLTARGLYLLHCFNEQAPRVQVVEVYPKLVLQHHACHEKGYKQNPRLLLKIVRAMQQAYGVKTNEFDGSNEHNTDSLLCALAGWHFAAKLFKNLHDGSAHQNAPVFVQPS